MIYISGPSPWVELKEGQKRQRYALCMLFHLRVGVCFLVAVKRLSFYLILPTSAGTGVRFNLCHVDRKRESSLPNARDASSTVLS